MEKSSHCSLAPKTVKHARWIPAIMLPVPRFGRLASKESSYSSQRLRRRERLSRTSTVMPSSTRNHIKDVVGLAALVSGGSPADVRVSDVLPLTWGIVPECIRPRTRPYPWRAPFPASAQQPFVFPLLSDTNRCRVYRPAEGDNNYGD